MNVASDAAALFVLNIGATLEQRGDLLPQRIPQTESARQVVCTVRMRPF
jgi:hypothetical protein